MDLNRRRNAVIALAVAVILLGVAVIPFADLGGEGSGSDGASVENLEKIKAWPDRRLSQPVGQPLKLHRDSLTSVVAGSSEPVGNRQAPLLTYTVEVEPSLRSEATALLSYATAALSDRDRGWVATGERRLQRVGSPAKANFRVALVQPETANHLCALAGLNTTPKYSCWNGQFAVLNVYRWRNGATGFHDMDRYRIYQINHEVGHALGYQHQYCPGAGAVAPIMQQQTIALNGCRPNGLPNP